MHKTIELLIDFISKGVEQDYKNFIDLPEKEKKECFSWEKSKEKAFFELFFLYYFPFHIRLSLGNEERRIEIRERLLDKIFEEIHKRFSIVNDILAQNNEIKSFSNLIEQAGHSKTNDIVTQKEEREMFFDYMKQETDGPSVYTELSTIAEIIYINRIKNLYEEVTRFVGRALRKSVIIEENPKYHSEIIEKLRSELSKEDNEDDSNGLYLGLARFSLENSSQEGLYYYFTQALLIATKCGFFWDHLREEKLV